MYLYVLKAKNASLMFKCTDIFLHLVCLICLDNFYIRTLFNRQFTLSSSTIGRGLVLSNHVRDSLFFNELSSLLNHHYDGYCKWFFLNRKKINFFTLSTPISMYILCSCVVQTFVISHSYLVHTSFIFCYYLVRI